MKMINKISNFNISEIVAEMLNQLLPFIFIISLYLIINGHKTPGGGFQGGALIAVIFMYSFLSGNEVYISSYTLQLIEKISLVFIILIPFLFLTLYLNIIFPQYNRIFLISMNIFIAIKVACGLSIAFMRFIIFEVR